jgi:hypothetical protein
LRTIWSFKHLKTIVEHPFSGSPVGGR